MEKMTEARLINAVYAECSGLPSALSANVTDQQLLTTGQRVYTVTAEWSQTDLVRGSRLRYSQQWTVITHSTDHQTTAVTAVLPPSPCIPVQGELLVRCSPVGGLRAVVRETAGHQLLEIWNSQGLTKCLDLTALGKHGRVYDDAQFGCLSWSDCETRLLYVAEKNRTSSESTGGKDRSVYSEDWGEGLTSRSVPVVCVVELVTGTLSLLQGIPPHVSPGQAQWAPDSQSVVLVGWWHEPFRLGLKFCSNRRSALFRVDLDGHCECLSGDNMSVSCPRLSPDRTCLVYLQGSVFGPHNQCLSLQLLDLGTRVTSTLLDVANRAAPAWGSGGFAGVYEALPTCCWSTDSQRVVFSSAKRNRKDLFVFDRKAKTLTILSDTPVSEPPPPPPYNVPPPPPPLPQLHLQRRHRQEVEGHSAVYGSWKLLTLQKDMMVVSCSSPNTPPTLRIGFLPSASCDTVNWTILQQPVTFDLSWTLLDVTPTPEEDNIHYSGLDFGAVLAKPCHLLPGVKIPLVVFIHGGPHSQFPAEWNATTAGLAKLGFAVLMVNYRGSTGFGQDSILSLIGRIGNQDVKDVHRAVHTALQSDATLDPDRLAVIGGSHGGFLSCHLVGQYPDFYRACVARNPVINAATLLGTSDIVDWRYSCVGIQYSYDQIPTAEALAAMLEKSPITHAAQIRVPVLLLLGGKDKRVSPHQGVELYRALKSRDSPVRVLWFPEDGHSLARVDTQAECFLNTVLWLQQHL